MSEYIVNLSGDWSEKLTEIVRCSDCRDYRESDETCHSSMWHNWDTPIEVEPNGFCSWGERK